MLSTSSHVRTNPWCFLFVSLCSLAWSTTSYWKPNIFLVFTTNWLIAYLAFRSKPSSNWHQLTWIAFQQTFPSICFPEARQYSYAFDHDLTQSSLQPSSNPTYTRAWKLFTQFQFYFSHSTIYPTHIPCNSGSFYSLHVWSGLCSVNCQHIGISLKLLSQTIWFTRSDTSILHCSNAERLWEKRLSFRQPLANNTTYPPQFAWGVPSDYWFWISDLPI